MSYESRKPNIKLIIDSDWFNLLITALMKNTEVEAFPSVIRSAEALIEKLLKYSRPFADAETDVDSVDMRFFPDEASEMIWQLLIGYSNFLEEGEDYYRQLKENHISKERKSKAE